MVTKKRIEQANIVGEYAAKVAALLVEAKMHYGRGWDPNGAEDAILEGARAISNPKAARKAA